MNVATSFIDAAQAERNLNLEIGDTSFDELVSRAGDAWAKNLSRIQVEDDDPQKLTTFYSCLYRTQLFPRIWHEPNENGEPVHFSPYDGRVHPGVLYTDNGFWDTYRTEY